MNGRAPELDDREEPGWKRPTRLLCQGIATVSADELDALDARPTRASRGRRRRRPHPRESEGARSQRRTSRGSGSGPAAGGSAGRRERSRAARATRRRAGLAGGVAILDGVSSRGRSLSMFVVQRSFRTVRRGYDRDEVDRHLELVSQWFTSTDVGRAFTHQRSELEERERALAGREADQARLVEGARLEADATLEGARRRADAAAGAASGRALTRAPRRRRFARGPSATVRRSSTGRASRRPQPRSSEPPSNGRRRCCATPVKRPRRCSPRRAPPPSAR